MQDLISFRSRGQTMVLVALMAIALIAFVALAVDGGNAYGVRREAQSAADAGAIAGTWVMVDYPGGSCPGCDVLVKVNEYAEMNGVPDTHLGDPIRNDNILAYWTYFDGSCVPVGMTEECQELHTWTAMPAGARGLHVVTHISTTTFFARAIGIGTVSANARATANFSPDGGILPIAVNEYWAGSQGKCPYTNCEEPYSFVRDPAVPPPFFSPDGGVTWDRNNCPNPYNLDVCQGPYEGYGENFGKAFAMLGADAKPNYGSSDPRSFVHLDYRYDAITEEDGDWHFLVGNDVWYHYITPEGKKDEMAAVIAAGGYSKLPIPSAIFEPPPGELGSPAECPPGGDPCLEQWGYCWDTPSVNNCFNYPETGQGPPYAVVESLSGADAAKEAQEMYDNGNYVKGRFAPGEHVVIMVYNGFASEKWGKGGVTDDKDDAVVIVGYFGAIIVGYGNDFDKNCESNHSPTPGNWQSYVPCISGNPNTVYAIASNDGPLVIDPSKLLDEFLPKKITLIHGVMDQ